MTKFGYMVKKAMSRLSDTLNPEQMFSFPQPPNYSSLTTNVQPHKLLHSRTIAVSTISTIPNRTKEPPANKSRIHLDVIPAYRNDPNCRAKPMHHMELLRLKTLRLPDPVDELNWKRNSLPFDRSHGRNHSQQSNVIETGCAIFRADS